MPRRNRPHRPGKLSGEEILEVVSQANVHTNGPDEGHRVPGASVVIRRAGFRNVEENRK